MTPEEYFKTAYQKPKGFFRPAEWVFEFAEAYHKAKVESVTDEAKKEFFKRLDNMESEEFDSYSLTDHIENFTTLLKQ